MPELRKDPIVNRWVIFATERSKRPHAFLKPVEHPHDISCPFCPGNESLTPPEKISRRDNKTIHDEPGWTIRLFPNKYPAIESNGEIKTVKNSMFESVSGVGVHDVVVETPGHEESMADLDNKSILEILSVFRERFIVIKKDSRMKYVHIFKNSGRNSGASQPHTHSQIVALPIIPETVLQELTSVGRYFKDNKSCVFCDLITKEREFRKRCIFSNKHFISIAPYASRVPYESWILPVDHRSNFENSTDEELTSLAEILLELLKRMKDRLNDVSYNFYFHTSPIGIETGINGLYHWHIEILPRMAHLAGFEFGSGMYINSVLPEDAAVLFESRQ